MSTIGFVGAGRMGEPMVERLLAAGHRVTVYARRQEVRERLRAAGATATDDLVRAAASSEVFLACVFSDDQLQEVAGEVIANLKAGAVFASHTTGPPGTVRSLAEKARPRDIAVVDAPVSGTDDDIRAGRITVLLGGGEDAVARCGAVVRAYADPVITTGPLGSALAVKLVNNLLFAANTQVVAAAVGVGERLGIAPTELLPALQAMSGASAAGLHMATLGTVEEFGTRVTPFMRKDVAACQATSEDLGLDTGWLLEVVREGPLSLTDVQ